MGTNATCVVAAVCNLLTLSRHDACQWPVAHLGHKAFRTRIHIYGVDSIRLHQVNVQRCVASTGTWSKQRVDLQAKQYGPWPAQRVKHHQSSKFVTYKRGWHEFKVALADKIANMLHLHIAEKGQHRSKHSISNTYIICQSDVLSWASVLSWEQRYYACKHQCDKRECNWLVASCQPNIIATPAIRHE